MIFRRTADGLVMVRQPEHGRQTGLFCSAWGNEEVDAVSNRAESIRIASTHHDDGWGTWELNPSIDPRTGHPAQFHSLTPVEHLPLYRAGIERAAFMDPFAGILVSMHGAGLYNDRYGTFRLVELDLNEDERILVNEFLADMAQMQDSLAHSLNLFSGNHEHVADEPMVREAYLRLQVWDRLSLQFLYFGANDGAIGPMPIRIGEFSELSCHQLGPLHLGLDPYPFADSNEIFAVESVTIPDRNYKNPEDFLETVRNAKTVTLECKATPFH